MKKGTLFIVFFMHSVGYASQLSEDVWRDPVSYSLTGHEDRRFVDAMAASAQRLVDGQRNNEQSNAFCVVQVEADSPTSSRSVTPVPPCNFNFHSDEQSSQDVSRSATPQSNSSMENNHNPLRSPQGQKKVRFVLPEEQAEDRQVGQNNDEQPAQGGRIQLHIDQGHDPGKNHRFDCAHSCAGGCCAFSLLSIIGTGIYLLARNV